jgi:hypothetical protein
MNKLLTMIKKRAPNLFAGSLMVAVLMSAALYIGTSTATGVNSLSLSPSSGSYNSGSTFTLNIYETSSTAINAAEADLIYNASQLQYVSSSTAGAFANYVSPTSTAGEFTISGASGGAGLTGTNLIGTVTFKTLTGSGSAAISFGSQSSILNAGGGETWNGTTTAASYTLTTPVTPPPPPPPPPGGGGSPPPSSGGSSTSAKSGGSTKTTAAAPAAKTSAVAVPATATATASNPTPVISGIAVSGVTTTSATVSWQTDLPATSVIEYGLSSKYGLTTQNSTMTTNHQLTLSAPNLSSATRYQFEVLSVTSGGVGATSSAQTFTTLGYAITIRVVDAHGKLVSGALVTADGQSQKSSSTGLVSFQNMPAGPLKVTIKIGNALTTRTISVSANGTTSANSPLQQFSLSAVRGSTNPVFYLVAMIGIVLVAVGSVLRPRKRLHPLQAGADAGTAIVTSSKDPAPFAAPIQPPADTPEPSSPGPVTISSLHPDNHIHEPGQIITPDSPKSDASTNPPDLTDPPTDPED